MGSVIEFTGGGGETIAELEETGLAETPLSSAIGPDERVRYGLVAKRGKVTVDRSGETTKHAPGRGHRTVTVVTDLRIVVAVGGDDSGDDRVIPIPIDSVADVEVEQSLLGGGLSVETDAGAVWSIPCKGELDGVVATIERARRAWRRADRLTAETVSRLERADSTLEGGDPDEALSALDRAEEVVVGARDRLRSFDGGDRILDAAGIDDCEHRIGALRRRAHAAVGDNALDRARAACDRDAYQDAVAAYADARDAYERALTYDGTNPDGDRLRARLSSIHEEESALARAPRDEAREAYDHAVGCENPLTADRAYRIALGRYRDLLGLSWGPTAFFVGDADDIQARILDVVDGIVDARLAAARRALSAADTFCVREATTAGVAACAVADSHLASARAVVDELAPDRSATLETYAGVVTDIRQWIAESGHDPTDRGSQDVTAGVAADDTDGVTAGIAVDADAETDDRPEEWGPLTEVASGQSPADEAGNVRTRTERERLAAAIDALNDGSLADLVADVWRAMGWEATGLAPSADQHDVVATQRRPVEVRTLVWTVHDPRGALSRAVVDRCGADPSEGDVAALVTTADVPDGVAERATDHGVKLLDSEALLDLLEDEGVTHLVDDHAE